MPTIVCLMVTQAGRFELAREAVHDFHAQTWPDKLLVIIHNGSPDRSEPDFASFGGPAVMVNRAAPGLSLGGLRNLTMCSGGFHAWVKDHNDAIFCQWDDDDRYHPDRLRLQVEPLLADPTTVATCLTDQLYYFTHSRQLWWVDWFRRRPRYNSVLIPGTIMVRASHIETHKIQYPEVGPDSKKGEDGRFLEAVIRAGPVGEVHNQGWCYLRRYHGKNTWDRKRFSSNADWMGKPAAELTEYRELLQERVAEYAQVDNRPAVLPASVMHRNHCVYQLQAGGELCKEA